MSGTDRPAAAGWRRWLPFAAVALAYAVVATHRIDLPGIFADAINPDYLVARILSPDPQRSITWVLFGNSLLGDRAPVLISLYHGSQQFWLGLPLYAVFGTTVAGVRLVHATFALGVLAALYALLVRGGVRAWLAATVGVLLALDPAFSYAFRTQAYITMAPAAWLLLGVFCLLRAAEPEAAKAGRWLFWSGVFCGLAAVGYFVWTFVLPPVAFAAWRWMRGVALRRPSLLVWALGLATGSAAYPVGYLLIARKLGSISGMLAFVRDQQAKLGAFESALPIDARLWHAWRMIEATVGNAWHSGIMFGGEMLATPGAGWKVAVVVALPYLLWLHAELRRRATPLLRLLAALPLSFVALALIFGNRLGGHHFVTLVPLFYAALGLGLWTLVAQRHRLTLATAMLPVALLGSVNVAGQLQTSERLAATHGRGFLSDAIHRFAADLNAMPEKPFLWFPDAVLALPVILLTNASVPLTDHMDDPEPRRTLCAGRDVAMVRIKDHPSEARAREWHANLGWDAPTIRPYAQADGTVVFDVLTYHGRRDGPACAAAAATTNSPGDADARGLARGPPRASP